MNTIRLANILLIVILVLMVGSMVAAFVTTKTIQTNENGDSELTTKFVGFNGKKSA